MKGGLTICADVAASRVSNQASVESSITAPGRTGSTQANSLGEPAYWIWSQRTEWVGEMDTAMRWPVTTVLCVSICGAKQPPQARASAEGSAAAASTASETTSGLVRKFMQVSFR